MLKEVDKDTRKYCLRFIIACYFLYVISISIKMVYSAEMVEIISAFGTTKSQVSLGLTIYYGAYTVGQFALAPFIKKVNMKWFITISTLLSALSFGMIGLTNELWHVYVILGLNGLFQTGIWGGIMYFVGKYIPDELSGFTSKFLGTGMAIGTAITYGFAALFVAISSWKITFVFFAAVTVVSVVVFWFSLKSTQANLSHIHSAKQEKLAQAQESGEQANSQPVDKKKIVKTVIFLGTVSFLACCVYYAYNSWFPNLLGEKFQMPSEYAIFITLLLPLAQAPCPMVTVSMCEKFKSTKKVGLLCSAIAGALLVVLCLTFKWDMAFVIVVSVVMLFFMRGLINMICTYIPLTMKKQVNTGSLSLILNAICTIAAAAIPLVTAYIIESGENGWLYFFITLASVSVIIIAMFVWKVVEEAIHKKKKVEIVKNN